MENNPREFTGLSFVLVAKTILSNQGLTCGEISTDQLRELEITSLIPSEVTSKNSDSIEIVNMIGLSIKKFFLRNPREFTGNVVNGISINNL